MQLRGEFVVRQLMDDTIAVPVGETARQLNGIILLNNVSRVIWQQLQVGTSLENIVAAVTATFDVSPEEAREDILEFLNKLRQAQLLDE